MQATANPLARDGVRQPLSWRSFLLIGVVLAIGLLTLDSSGDGPHSSARDWGFHAEWKDYTSGPEQSLLTVVQVTPGGEFDRTGIRPGMAFGPRHSASFGPHFGGLYSVFAGCGNTTRVRMLDDPHSSIEHFYDLTR